MPGKGLLSRCYIESWLGTLAWVSFRKAQGCKRPQWSLLQPSHCSGGN